MEFIDLIIIETLFIFGIDSVFEKWRIPIIWNNWPKRPFGLNWCYLCFDFHFAWLTYLFVALFLLADLTPWLAPVAGLAVVGLNRSLHALTEYHERN
jgi:hypothetical protein